MDDIVKRLRDQEMFFPDLYSEAADEIERLRAGGCARDQGTTQYCAEAAALAAEVERLRDEVQTWVAHTKTAVWSDSEECKLLTAENERLRAALREYVCNCPKGMCEYSPCGEFARAALEDRT